MHCRYFKVREPEAAAAAVGAGRGRAFVEEQAAFGREGDHEGHQEGRAVQGRRGDVLGQGQEAQRRPRGQLLGGCGVQVGG